MAGGGQNRWAANPIIGIFLAAKVAPHVGGHSYPVCTK